ncbi:MAG TPA: hypothetical protein VLX85_07250 [Stellaceae bacterium]|nr:hypothetical protein [Stellaceae bacterium]
MSRIAPSLRGAAALALLLAAATLGGCAQPAAESRVTSTVPMVGGDVAGAGGKMDETYRQIYTPGDPNWSH